MPVQKLTNKKATARSPQVVTLIVDDSGSMSATTAEGPKNEQATSATKQLVMTMQSWNQGSTGSRYILNIAKFGSSTIPIAEASKPEAVSLNNLVFAADSGGTEMPEALAWASQALQKALSECRKIPGYAEEGSPNPLVLFFSDGENTGGDVGPVAKALKSIPFSGGAVDVVAVGIGMDQKDFPVMEGIASRPDLSVNIDPKDLAEFIADVGATLQKGESPETLIKKYDS
jgi:uncharacterized protein YegL